MQYIDTPQQANARLARAYRDGQPDPAVELAARRNLVSARLYKHLRDMLPAVGGLDGLHCAHLVGCIMGESGVNYEAARVLEQAVRAAVAAAQGEA